LISGFGLREMFGLDVFLAGWLGFAEAVVPLAVGAGGVIVLVKSGWLVGGISGLDVFRGLGLDFGPLLPPKRCRYGGAFRC